jgi:hypothetical protein
MFYAMQDLVIDTRKFIYKEDTVIPEPNACAHCGENKKFHGMTSSVPIGIHTWIQPTQDIILKRMKARREIQTKQVKNQILLKEQSFTKRKKKQMMTVSEIIEKLQTLPQDLPAVLQTYDGPELIQAVEYSEEYGIPTVLMTHFK